MVVSDNGEGEGYGSERQARTLEELAQRERAGEQT
jgi:hypothetical protein